MTAGVQNLIYFAEVDFAALLHNRALSKTNDHQKNSIWLNVVGDG